jgi:DNA-binding transcriptional ArsR family regulator
MGGDAVSHYIERLGVVLNQVGIQRTAGRVFAALMVSDEGALTARELAERLSASPAAISGAVRYLEQVAMVRRTRRPGERRDRYVLIDLWYATFFERGRLMSMWRDATVEGIEAVGAGSPAAVRLAEMRDFLEFVIAEMPAMRDRWLASRD